MDGVAEAQRRVATEHHARLAVFVGEPFGVQRREVLQTGVLHKVSVWERLFGQVDLALFAGRQPRQE